MKDDEPQLDGMNISRFPMKRLEIHKNGSHEGRRTSQKNSKVAEEPVLDTIKSLGKLKRTKFRLHWSWELQQEVKRSDSETHLRYFRSAHSVEQEATTSRNQRMHRVNPVKRSGRKQFPRGSLLYICWGVAMTRRDRDETKCFTKLLYRSKRESIRKQ